MKIKEKSVYQLTELFIKTNSPKKICDLVKKLADFTEVFPKAKIAKMIKVLMNKVHKMDNTIDIEIELCNWLIKWGTDEKKILFLQHRIEIRLATLFLKKQKYPESLEIVERLLVEIRKIDDKPLLVEIQILES